MKKSEFLETLGFNGFERYPPQFSAIYLKCEGYHKLSRRYKCHFIRVNKFNALTFEPKSVIKQLNNEHVDWVFSWLPTNETDKKYDKGDFDQLGAQCQ